MRKVFQKLALFFLLGLSWSAWGMELPMTFTYQGEVMNEAGTDPLLASVSMVLGIYDPSGTCLLYEERQDKIDLAPNQGGFAIKVGSALPEITQIKKRTIKDPGLSMVKLFSNKETVLPAETKNCLTGYTPRPNDGRMLKSVVINGDSSLPMEPNLEINSVPYSMVAETIQGVGLNNLLQTNSFKDPHVESATVLARCGGVNSESKWITKSKFYNQNCSLTFAPGTFASKPSCFVTLWVPENAQVEPVDSIRILESSTKAFKFRYQYLNNKSQKLKVGAKANIICLGSKQ